MVNQPCQLHWKPVLRHCNKQRVWICIYEMHCSQAWAISVILAVFSSKSDRKNENGIYIYSAEDFFSITITCNLIRLCNYFRVLVWYTSLLGVFHWILILCLFFFSFGFFAPPPFLFILFFYVFVQHRLILYFCQHDQGCFMIAFCHESRIEQNKSLDNVKLDSGKVGPSDCERVHWSMIFFMRCSTMYVMCTCGVFNNNRV